MEIPQGSFYQDNLLGIDQEFIMGILQKLFPLIH